jgi:hypothetical protein
VKASRFTYQHELLKLSWFWSGGRIAHGEEALARIEERARAELKELRHGPLLAVLLEKADLTHR